MLNYSVSIIFGLVILTLAIPYVTRIRHPQQKPLAAYLIFVSVFVMASGILFTVVGWLVGMFELESSLEEAGGALLFLTLVFLPTIVISTHLARKPPLRQDPLQ